MKIKDIYNDAEKNGWVIDKLHITDHDLEKRQSSVFYGGIIMIATKEDFILTLAATGDICFKTKNGDYYKDKNNSGLFSNETGLYTDESISGIEFDHSNWFELTIYDKANDSYITDGCDDVSFTLDEEFNFSAYDDMIVNLGDYEYDDYDEGEE